jgi:hypothetical protein
MAAAIRPGRAWPIPSLTLQLTSAAPVVPIKTGQSEAIHWPEHGHAAFSSSCSRRLGALVEREAIESFNENFQTCDMKNRSFLGGKGATRRSFSVLASRRTASPAAPNILLRRRQRSLHRRRPHRHPLRHPLRHHR